MTDLLGQSSPWSRAALAVGLDVAIKAAALILGAATIHLALGRRRVLIRSMAWNACLAGLLLLPVAASAFPRLRVACLPGVAVASGPVDRPATPILPVADPVARPAGLDPPAEAGPANAPRAPSSRFDLAATIVLAYAAVAAALVLRLLLAIAAVGALRRGGVAVAGRGWVDALDRWRERLGIARPVGLIRSGRVGVPVVVGWARPTILLPEALADAAAPAAIDAVLLHELAHVRRGDYPWNLLLRLVRAIYWPHPLTWPLGRVVGGLRERACDDLCVYWMGDATAYRATLVELAAGLVRRPGPALGLAMARSTKLGRRLAEIDRSPGAARCLPRRPARAAILAVSITAVALLGSLRLARTAAAPPEPAAQPPAPEAPKPRAEDPAPKADAPEAEPKPKVDDRQFVVSVETLKKGPFRRTATVPGTAQPFQSADLHARVAGYVKELKVDIGDRVKKGEVLATIVVAEPGAGAGKDRLAARLAQARLRQAQAAVRAAEAALEGDGAKVDEARAAVKKAEADVLVRRSEHARYEELVKQNAIHPVRVEGERNRLEAAESAAVAARAQVRAAESTQRGDRAGLEGARAGLDVAALGVEAAEDAAEAGTRRAKEQDEATRIVAPFDGLVNRRSANDGDFVRPAGDRAAPVVTVAQMDPIRMVVAVPDSFVPFLDRGDPATVRFDALGDRTFPGKVSRIAAELNSDTLRAEIDLANPDGRIRAGQYGTVTIVLDEGPTLTIPGSAIVTFQGGGDRVICYRVVDGRAVGTKVKLGDQHSSMRPEVLDGLAEGDTVIACPPESPGNPSNPGVWPILHGRPVTIRPAADPPGTRPR